MIPMYKTNLYGQTGKRISQLDAEIPYCVDDVNPLLENQVALLHCWCGLYGGHTSRWLTEAAGLGGAMALEQPTRWSCSSERRRAAAWAKESGGAATGRHTAAWRRECTRRRGAKESGGEDARGGAGLRNLAARRRGRDS